MGENTCKFEIKIDPLDLHIGLKDKMAEFESLIRMTRPGVSIAEKIEKDLNSRFCHCCFFGIVKGELMGEPLCEECARALYDFDEKEKHPRIRKIDPYYQLWYRRNRALPIFEAYLHSEVERYKLEQKLEDVKASNYTESVDAGMENRRLKRALWLSRASEASKEVNYWTTQDESSYAIVDFNVRHETIVSHKSPHHRPYKWILIWENVERKCLKKAEEY
jgi:hypothetical protein